MSIARRRKALTAAVRRTPVPALLFVSIVGWGTMVWLTAMLAAGAPGGSSVELPGAVHGAHGVDAATSAPHGIALWLAMVLAMSPLLLAREVRRLWAGSLRRRRGATLLAFTGAYGIVWLLVGAIAVPLAVIVGQDFRLGLLAVVVVGAWQCSPLRQRMLNVCHRIPRLRVFGAGALGDAGRHGLVSGAACAASCAPIMLLVLLAADFHLVAMMGASVLLAVERYRPARRPRWRLPFAPAPPEHAGLPRGSRAAAAAR